MQKKALKTDDMLAKKEGRQRKKPPQLCLWNVGFTLIIVGSILDFVAFGLAPQSLLAPLGALTLVWNMVRI